MEEPLSHLTSGTCQLLKDQTTEAPDTWLNRFSSSTIVIYRLVILFLYTRLFPVEQDVERVDRRIITASRSIFLETNRITDMSGR